MRSRWLSCLLFAAAVACGGADDGDAISGPGVGLGGMLAGGGTTGGLGTTGGPAVATPGGVAAGTTPGAAGGAATPGGVAGTGGATTGGAGGTAAGATMIPCNVQKVLQDKCNTCHSNPPTGAAPMPLVTPADFQVASRIKPAEKISQRVKARIAETGQTSMPPPGRDQLTADEKAALNAFLDGGAKGVPQASCGNVTPTPGGTGGTGGMGGSSTVNWDTDCDYTQEFLAHSGQTATDTQPFNASKQGDQYEIFWFTPKWNEKVHVIDIQPIIDNASVLHHWLLYMKSNASEPNGSHNPDSGLQSADSALLSGWAPGNKSFVFPADVGMQVVQGSSARFGIEIHYNTSGNPTRRTDRSGAKVCATKKLRQKEAATHWLGTQFIVSPFGGKFDATGVCSVKQTSHIIAHSPHMHKTGRYMKTIVTKKSGGSKVTITDKPFSFDDQQIFPVNSPTGEIVVEPGDIIDTTCSYDAPGPITFGPGTDSEMCYNFVVAWPVGSLSNGAAGVVGGKNTCIDGI